MVSLSVSMALTALREQVETVIEAEENLRRQRAIRDDLIRDARDNDIPYRALIALTGIKRDHLYNIVNSPRFEPSPYLREVMAETPRHQAS